MAVPKVLAVILHTLGAAVMTYAWFELDTLPTHAWVVKQKGGHMQFLTIQGCVLQRRGIPSKTQSANFAHPQARRCMGYHGLQPHSGLHVARMYVNSPSRGESDVANVFTSAS